MNGAKLISLLLTLAMLLGMLPAAALAEEDLGKVHVIVENTTFTEKMNGKTPAWTGNLIDTDVALSADSTMMSCIVAALNESSVEATIDENTEYGGYIRAIGGIAEKDAAEGAGWMGTINDWFSSTTFDKVTVADGSLSAGDEIRVMYTCNLGTDLGSDYTSTDKSVKAVAFSAGRLDKTFAADTHEYTLNVPEGTKSVVVTPTAACKNYQVRTCVGETEYKRSAEIPVEVGTVITVKCGDPEWPSMNANEGEAQTYTFTVALEEPHTPIEAYVTFSNGGAFLKDKDGANAVSLKVELDTKTEYTIDDIFRAAHEQYAANGADDYATATGTYGLYITKLWGVETSSVGYYLNGAMANGLTDKVASGDRIEAMIYADAETYAAFDKTTVETDDETSFELTLKSATFDESGNMSMVPCEGATITVDGKATDAVTDAEGKAIVTIATAGAHVVSATKTKTTGEGEDAKEVSAITAPYCSVTVAATSIDSGKYGNVVWKLREDGTLEFSAVPGSDGKMGTSFNKYYLPNYVKKYSAQIKSIVVKEGVTDIGNNAFYNLTAVTSVSLPSTLTTIGDEAFSGVKGITSFTCAEGCALNVVDNFVLKEKGTEIYMVIDESKLNGVVTVPDGVTKIGLTFNGSDITGIIFPDSVVEISGMDYSSYTGAFGNCAKLESITIPCNITDYAFRFCTALKEVTFKEGVTSVVTSAFQDCTALTTVNLPKSMETLPAGAFDGCTAITTINCAEGGAFSMKDNVLMKNGTEIVYVLPSVQYTGELVIPEGVTAIADRAYINQTKITSIKFPSTLKSIGSSAFNGCTGLTGELTISENVTTIGSYAFKGCTEMTGVKLPSKLETIGSYAFDSTGLTALELPATLKSVGDSAFQKTKIKTLNLPDGLNLTEGSEFAECAELTEVSVGGNLAAYGTFSSCAALTTITVREGVTSIDGSAFSDCTALTTVNLPASLTTLSSTAFSGCTALKSINFAEGSSFSCVDGIVYGDNAIAFVLSIDKEELTIKDGVTEIGNRAFRNQKGLKKVTLPDSLVKIGNQAFNGCTNLASINLPENLQEIGYSAFNGCTSLTMVTFPASLKTIGNQAFRKCTNMKGRLYLPSTITSFGQYAFDGCTGITSVYFEDAADPANTTYSDNILASCTGMTDVRLPENLAKLNSMLSKCSGLRKLVLPESIKEITYSDLPNGLMYLDMKGVTKFDQYALSNLLSLKELYLCADLTAYPDSGRNCHPEIIYFRGTEEQWNAMTFASTTLENFEKYGTVIVFNYGSETGDTPEITQQPVSATYEQGLRPAPLTIEVNELEGAQYVYHWYCDGEYVASGKECAISTSVAGSHEYYCMVRCSVNGKYSEAKSDTAIITVTELAQAFEGEGTEDNPYKLTRWQDLERLSVLVEGGESFAGKVFKMTENITLPTGWKPIGCTKDGQNGINYGANLNAFSGTFDGGDKLLTVPAGERPLFAYVNGATIRHLNIYGIQINGYGLVDCFTGVGMSGTAMIIDDVTLKSGTQTLESGLIGARRFDNPYAGCSVGYNATIRNCTIEAGVVIGYTGDRNEIGGFAGRMQGTVENCVNHGTVKGKNYVGGIIATQDNAMGACTVKDCSFDGTVTGSRNVGGIVGGGYSDSSAPNGCKVTVENCTAGGTVTGDTNVGGILGGDEYVAQAWDNCAYTFKNNTFTGKISGSTNVGAIIGYYHSLNRIDNISGNQYAKDCGADKPIAKVFVVDTNYAAPTAFGDTIYCNTESSIKGCPSVTGCGWQTGYNRTDDPLGKDMAKLFKVIGAVEVTLGDVNADGEIDLDDVLMTNDCFIGNLDLTGDQFTAADVDQSGEIDLDDVLMINDYFIGNLDEFTPAA